jgi:hypothetical protein
VTRGRKPLREQNPCHAGVTLSLARSGWRRRSSWRAARCATHAPTSPSSRWRRALHCNLDRRAGPAAQPEARPTAPRTWSRTTRRSPPSTRAGNRKVSPDQVREQLARLHPGTFCLPTVSALQNVFIALGQKQKTGGTDAVLRPRGSRGPKSVGTASRWVPCGR